MGVRATVLHSKFRSEDFGPELRDFRTARTFTLKLAFQFVMRGDASSESPARFSADFSPS